MFTHEDERRKLVEWSEGEFKTAKVVIAKENCVVGDHHHNKKDEEFLLLSGKAKKVVIGETVEIEVDQMRKWVVPRGTYHLFDLDKDAILLGTATERFSKEDEIPGR